MALVTMSPPRTLWPARRREQQLRPSALTPLSALPEYLFPDPESCLVMAQGTGQGGIKLLKQEQLEVPGQRESPASTDTKNAPPPGPLVLLLPEMQSEQKE